jgi:hypothetical protein
VGFAWLLPSPKGLGRGKQTEHVIPAQQQTSTNHKSTHSLFLLLLVQCGSAVQTIANIVNDVRIVNILTDPTVISKVGMGGWPGRFGTISPCMPCCKQLLFVFSLKLFRKLLTALGYGWCGLQTTTSHT